MSNPSVVSNTRAASLDLAMIGNCAISALVDATAHVVWCCMPRFDSPPVFDALMQSANGVPEAGAMGLDLVDMARSEQSYDHGTAILRTRLWDTQGGCVEVVDFAPRFVTRDRVFRPAQLVRRIRPLAGRPRVRVTVRPHGSWGAEQPQITRGSHHVRYVMPEITLRLNTSVPLTYLMDGTAFALDREMSLFLGADETMTGGIDETAREFED